MTRRTTLRLSSLVAATLVAATGLVGLQVGPAAAAVCSGGGVSALVDFQSLGGGVVRRDATGRVRIAPPVRFSRLPGSG